MLSEQVSLVPGQSLLGFGAIVAQGGAGGVGGGAAAFETGAAAFNGGAVFVKTGATAESSGQLSRSSRQRRKQAGLGDRNRGRVDAINETSDCRPVLYELLIAFFKNCIRASIFICIILAAIIFSVFRAFSRSNDPHDSSHTAKLDTTAIFSYSAA